MAKNNKIFLIGFMGSGKTTLGKKLAVKLSKPFFDLDVEIEKLEGLTVNSIFEKHGEPYFRHLETQTLKELISNNDSFILSLGGGTPCLQENIDLINSSGVSIYLKYDAEVLAFRLINAKENRPLIKGLDQNQLEEYIGEKLKEREHFYCQCKYTVENKNIRVEDLITLEYIT